VRDLAERCTPEQTIEETEDEEEAEANNDWPFLHVVHLDGDQERCTKHDGGDRESVMQAG
jgi:hypothetical protein